MIIKEENFITQAIIEAVIWTNILFRGKVSFCGSFGLAAHKLLNRPLHDVDCITDENWYGSFFQEIGQYGLSTSSSEKFTVDGVLVLCFKLTAPNGIGVDVMYRKDGCVSDKVWLEGTGSFYDTEIRLEKPESAIEVKRNYLNIVGRKPNPKFVVKHTFDLEYIDSLNRLKLMNNPTDILTLENFWNEMKLKYPNAVKDWCDWVDDYKKKVDWNGLFHDGKFTENTGIPVTTKVHELPIALQVGLFIQYRFDCRFHPGLFEINSDWKEQFRRFFHVREAIITNHHDD
jgi:hypothetical protein